MKQDWELLKTSNGLRVLLLSKPSTASISALVLSNVGSRSEDSESAGLAHFLEHLVHDGTKKYPTNKDWAELIDSVGADSNAMTAEEYTGYYVKAEADKIDLCLEALSEIMLYPLMAEEDIAKEKQIIIEEINMREDTPQIKVYDRTMEVLFKGHGLGLPGAGTKQTVSSFTQKMLSNFKEKHYVANNMLLVLSGNIGKSQKNVLDKVEKNFGNLPAGVVHTVEPFTSSESGPIVEIIKKETDQVHLAFGFRGFSRKSEKRYAQALLSVILGGGFSSRLMQKIRQELGLAYSVHTDIDLFTDTGVFFVTAGVDKSRIVLAVENIWKELQNVYVGNGVISDTELKKAKDYLRGKTALQLEDSFRLAMYHGIQLLLEGEFTPYNEVLKKIDEVNLDDVVEVAKELFDSQNMSLVIVGSIPNKENEFVKIFKNKK